MRVRALALLALFVVFGATVSAAAKVRSQHDPAFDFSKVKTYRFKLETGPAPEGLDRRIRTEIRAQLTKKGLRELPPGEETPDVLVGYAAGSVDQIGPGFQVVAGWYGDLLAVPGNQSTITGGLLIEMGDPKSGKGVWAATYIMRGTTPNALQVMVDRAEKAVRGALSKYPPR
jgi:uncharacterized protein DUF4136